MKLTQKHESGQTLQAHLLTNTYLIISEEDELFPVFPGSDLGYITEEDILAHRNNSNDDR